jgi:hypothetical protein
MPIQWIGDERDLVATDGIYRLHLWRDDDDWSWTVAIGNGPLARGFAATLEEAKDAATEAVEDHRGGALQ